MKNSKEKVRKRNDKFEAEKGMPFICRYWEK